MRWCKCYIALMVGLLLPNFAYAYIYGKAIVKSQPTKGGVVYVSQTSAADAEQNIKDNTYSKSEDSSTLRSAGFLDTNPTNFTIYFTCRPNDGYAFKEWTCSDVSFSQQSNPKSKTTQNTVTCSSVTRLSPSNMGTYYANFIASQVISGEVKTQTPVAVEGEPGGVSEKGEVIFTVKNADEIADFTCEFEGAGFDFYGTDGTNGTYENSASFENGQITIKYRYKAENVAGLHHGKIKLISKGTDDGTTYSSVSVDISAKAQFTPDFSVRTPYNYNDENSVFVGTAVASTNVLFPIPQNGAASAKSAVNGENGTVWKVWLTDDAANVFKITNGIVDDDNKYVVENGEVVVLLTSKNKGMQTATLHIQCVYYDKEGSPSNVVEKVIELTADATFSDESKITFAGQENYTYTFATTYTETPVQATIPIAIVNVKNCTSSFDKNGDVFGCVLGDLDMQLSLLSSNPGDYSATLTVSGDDSRDGMIGKTSATMQVSGKVLLRKPQLTALSGHSQVTLQWQPVVGATEYIIKSGDNVLATLPADVTEYVHTGLSAGQNISYTLTAVYSPDEQFNTSATVTATTGVITAGSAAHTGLQTGTDHPTNNTFPYQVLRDIDLSSAFGDGKAACDLLYIFGVTTNTDGLKGNVNGVAYDIINQPTTKSPSNAKTPCYIYQKDGDNYRYKETIENMNIPSKPSQFKISANGQKLYFTGYCPMATTGSTDSEDGVIYVEGGKNAKVDLYLSDLQLYPRIKRKDGHSGNADTAKVDFSIWTFKMYTKGSGSSIVFRSSSTSSSAPFMPKIHVHGDNTLEGTQGSFVKVSVAGIEKYAGQYSAPLSIQVTDIDQCTTLSIDDQWFSPVSSSIEHCAGILRLTKRNNNAPSIDIGNANTVVQFDGGQIHLENAVPVSQQYETAFAISYRSYSIEKAGIKASIYGIGGDQTGGIVRFNDGSIHCKPLNKTTLGQYASYYRDLTSMKCPKNTTINGGTFDCDIWTCEAPSSLGASPTNYAGDSLQKVAFKI